MSEPTNWTVIDATLTCGHDTWILDTTAPIQTITDAILHKHIARRQDGWWAARRCLTCRRRRAVRSLRVKGKLVTGLAPSSSPST